MPLLRADRYDSTR